MAQLLLSPVLIRHNWVCLFAGNTLYLVAFAQYIYVTCKAFSPFDQLRRLKDRLRSGLQCASLPDTIRITPFPHRHPFRPLHRIAIRIQHFTPCTRTLLLVAGDISKYGSNRRSLIYRNLAIAHKDSVDQKSSTRLGATGSKCFTFTILVNG